MTFDNLRVGQNTYIAVYSTHDINENTEIIVANVAHPDHQVFTDALMRDEEYIPNFQLRIMNQLEQESSDSERSRISNEESDSESETA